MRIWNIFLNISLLYWFDFTPWYHGTNGWISAIPAACLHVTCSSSFIGCSGHIESIEVICDEKLPYLKILKLALLGLETYVNEVSRVQTRLQNKFGCEFVLFDVFSWEGWSSSEKMKWEIGKQVSGNLIRISLHCSRQLYTGMTGGPFIFLIWGYGEFDENLFYRL